MTQEYPKWTAEARRGSQGVAIVSRLVERWGWLFRTVHQEHDFGLDAYVDLITPEGGVTGHTVALQIKCGKSFFQEKTADGYVFRGERKHFNFLCNQATPVLIVICRPDSEECFWVEFDQSSCAATQTAWKIVVPFGNKLNDSRSKLEQLMESENHLDSFQHASVMTEAMIDSKFINFIITRDEVKAREFGRARDFFDGLKRTKALARSAQGKVEISFFGYDDDPRELFEIDEVRWFIPILDAALPDLFFFVRTEKPTSTLMVFALSQSPPQKPKSSGNAQILVEADLEFFSAFLSRHWFGLNAMTDWVGMSNGENEAIGRGVIRCLGLEEISKFQRETGVMAGTLPSPTGSMSPS